VAAYSAQSTAVEPTFVSLRHELDDIESTSHNSRMKYRTIKTPPVCGHLTIEDAERSARTVARMNGSKTFRVETELRTFRSKTNSHKSGSTGITKARTVTAGPSSGKTARKK